MDLTPATGRRPPDPAPAARRRAGAAPVPRGGEAK